MLIIIIIIMIIIIIIIIATPESMAGTLNTHNHYLPTFLVLGKSLEKDCKKL